MHNKPKLIILAGVFILSTIFFWAAINQLLLPSRAQQGGKVSVFLFEDAISCNPQGVCIVHPYMNSDQGAGVSGIQGVVSYPTGFSFIGAGADSSCTTPLDTQLQLKDEPNSHTVSFAFVSLKKDAELPSGGPHCIAGFQLKAQSASSGEVALMLPEKWQATGSVKFIVSIDPKKTVVTASDSAGITPPVGGAGACQTKIQGDCDCDGKTNMKDFEAIRPGLVGEPVGSTCDSDGDGLTDQADYDIWKSQAEFLK